ncbi:MAG TPA: hypothetical protein VN643_03700 [Pyrinomonadaceae bacterium]|nr:hypothetical protein [Pyrinomonadaceae bacterium]
MNTSETYRRFRDAQGENARNCARGADEEHSSYFSDLQQLGAKAGSELQQAYDNYLQELQAASAGDDSIQRATTAYKTLQSEYSRIQAEYTQDLAVRHERMLNTMNSLTSTSTVKALDNWIEYLNGVKQNLVQPAESKPSG